MSEYAKRDLIGLAGHYTKHVQAMTAEGLHTKSDIAAELAWRDAENEQLREMLARLYAGSDLYCDDGELQDARAEPFIDFKRDSVADIRRAIVERGEQR